MKKKKLKPNKTIMGDHYQQQLINLSNTVVENRLENLSRQCKVVLLDDNALPHRGKPTKDIIKQLN